MRFYVERTARAVLTIWAALTLMFFIIRLIPGGPITVMRNRLQRQFPQMTTEQINEQLNARLQRIGFNYTDPPWIQYVDWMVGVMTGDLGQSLQTEEQVTAIVAGALPWTLFTMTTATFIIFLLAVTWGAVMAYYEGTMFDGVSSSISILFSAIPSYVLGFFLLIFFAYGFTIDFNFLLLDFQWTTPAPFPSRGRKPNFVDPGLNPKFIFGALNHAVLIIASVVLTKAGLQILAMRGNSIQILGEDYVRVARLRGLADTRIATRYVSRNAILPLYTSFLTLIGFNLGASIILEELFVYQGIGWEMLRSLESRDYPVMMGTFMTYTVTLVLAVFVADLTYSFIDPRVKTGDNSEVY